MRGKRGINYQNQLECLNMFQYQVKQQNFDVEIIIKILLIQITISFDYHHEYVKLETWTRALDYIEELSENINLKLTSCHIYDDLITLILQIDEEYTNILQNTNLHREDYIDRLKDELRIYSILDRFKLYFELNNQSQHLCSIYFCIIKHIYYKYDKTSIELIDHLCKYIYTNDTRNHALTRASLCHIYHLALHDYYNKARDLIANLIERLRLLEERDKLLNFFENESKILVHSQDKDFADESFENIRAPGEHEYFELAHHHYHWNRMEPRRSLHLDKKLRDEEMSDVHNWPPYKYLAENCKYDLVDYVPLNEKLKRRKEDLPPSGKPPYYKQYFF